MFTTDSGLSFRRERELQASAAVVSWAAHAQWEVSQWTASTDLIETEFFNPPQLF